jgi:hypothetical protein
MLDGLNQLHEKSKNMVGLEAERSGNAEYEAQGLSTCQLRLEIYFWIRYEIFLHANIYKNGVTKRKQFMKNTCPEESIETPKLHGLSPQANRTDRTTAACRRS